MKSKAAPVYPFLPLIQEGISFSSHKNNNIVKWLLTPSMANGMPSSALHKIKTTWDIQHALYSTIGIAIISPVYKTWW